MRRVLVPLWGKDEGGVGERGENQGNGSENREEGEREMVGQEERRRKKDGRGKW